LITVHELHDKAQTGEEMYKLVRRFSGDINHFTHNGKPLSQLPISQYYSLVKKVPFRKDDYGVEIVTRPYHLFASPWRGWDCKKKALAVASWLHENNIPYRFTSVSRRPDGEIHHVLVEAMKDGEWIPIDATYPENELYQEEPWTNRETLPTRAPGTLSDAPRLVSMYGEGVPSSHIADQFYRAMYRMAPEQMGEPATIIAAIIGVVATVVATVIGVVSGKRRQEELLDHQVQMARMQQEFQAEQTAEAAKQYEQATQTQQASAGSGIPGWLIPAAAALGLIALS